MSALPSESTSFETLAAEVNRLGAAAWADARFGQNAALGRITEMTLKLAAERYKDLQKEERKVCLCCLDLMNVCVSKAQMHWC